MTLQERTDAKNEWTITLIYNNIPDDNRFKTDWGFSAWVHGQGHTTLFDTGGSGNILLDNMQAAGLDPEDIKGVVLSHAHKDHTGGLRSLLDQGIHPQIFLPSSMPASSKQDIPESCQVITTTPGQEILPGQFTTGEMGSDILEQSLILRSSSGMIVITGCAHPGIVNIIDKAQSLFNDPVYMTVGGFHLRDKSQTEINAILESFRRLGVEKVSPNHCTGKKAIAAFAREYGEHFVPSGTGTVIQVGNPAG